MHRARCIVFDFPTWKLHVISIVMIEGIEAVEMTVLEDGTSVK